MIITNNTFVKVGILTLAVSACTKEGPVKQVSVDQIRSACTREAEQLIKSVIIYEQPIESKSTAIVLESGRFIYRCEKQDDWVAIIYPEVGEKVDCNYRKIEQQCSLGWIKEELTTLTFD